MHHNGPLREFNGFESEKSDFLFFSLKKFFRFAGEAMKNFFFPPLIFSFGSLLSGV